MNYFIIENGQQCGPLSVEQLRSKCINGETPVWCEGMPQWEKQKTYPSCTLLSESSNLLNHLNLLHINNHINNQTRLALTII